MTAHPTQEATAMLADDIEVAANEQFKQTKHATLTFSAVRIAMILAALRRRAASPGAAGVPGREAVESALDFLDALAFNEHPNERKPLNPIIIGKGAASIAKKLRALTPDHSSDVGKLVATPSAAEPADTLRRALEDIIAVRTGYHAASRMETIARTALEKDRTSNG